MATDRAAPGSATTSQLLLAILDEGEGVACRILMARHVDMVDLKQAATRVT